MPRINALVEHENLVREFEDILKSPIAKRSNSLLKNVSPKTKRELEDEVNKVLQEAYDAQDEKFNKNPWEKDKFKRKLGNTLKKNILTLKKSPAKATAFSIFQDLPKSKSPKQNATFKIFSSKSKSPKSKSKSPKSKSKSPKQNATKKRRGLTVLL
jgi:hypothetical protein